VTHQLCQCGHAEAAHSEGGTCLLFDEYTWCSCPTFTVVDDSLLSAQSTQSVASIGVLLAAAIEIAEHEYETHRTLEAAQLIVAMRQAAGSLEVYQTWQSVSSRSRES